MTNRDSAPFTYTCYRLLPESIEAQPADVKKGT
jgi:hypothetical protein